MDKQELTYAMYIYELNYTKRTTTHNKTKTENARKENANATRHISLANSFHCGDSGSSRRSLSPSCASFYLRAARSRPEGKASAA